MPKITALLHTKNDGQRLGRTLQSLRPCDEVLVIDDCSDDDTAKVAREYGATLKTAIPGVTAGAYAMDANNEWILCLYPNESLSDDLEAALFEWKETDPDGTACYNVPIREESSYGWQKNPPQVRLFNRTKINWIGDMPEDPSCDAMLTGDLLRFHQP